MIDIYDIEIDDDLEDSDELQHYGTPRHSGRYPFGSGKNPYQHQDDRSIYRKNKEFLTRVSELKKQGINGKELAEQMHCKNTSDLRAKISAASNTNKKIDILDLQKYLDQGYSMSESARRVGIAESTARSLLSPKTKANAFKNTDIANQLKEAVANKKYIDVGKGSETMLGDGSVSNDRLDKVLKSLENEGYNLYEIKSEQPTNPGKFTTYKVLAGPDATFQEVSRNRAEIRTIAESPNADDSAGILGLERPAALEGSRVYIRYPSEGGAELDGTIQIRRGVPDLYLGDNTAYSQVRINVDDKHYLKGMALYGDNNDIPPGYDVVFNTSKPDGTPPEKVFKPLKTDKQTGEINWANPFGASIKPQDPNVPQEDWGQYHYKDPVTGELKLSKINKVNTQGDWDDWSVTLASQFLSKQPVKLIKQQLERTIDISEAEFDEIRSVPNPIVKSYLLKEFASECDSSAEDLKATGFPRQSQKVILPLTSLKPGECYCPTYDDGEELILIRYPHSGTFEIPKVRVNNRNQQGIDIFGNAQDVIGIRGETAAQLSGADYDGDSVTCIPIRGMEKDIKYEAFRSELKTFTDNFHEQYKKPADAEETGKEPKGSRKFDKGMQMGMTTNLIMDMTLQDAPIDDIIKAVKHSMVVIDAEKHNLDWKQSEIDNDIARLKKEYQGKTNGGASTLISRAKSPSYIDEWDPVKSKIDPDTGKIIRMYTGKTVVDKNGKEKVKQIKSSKMMEAEDARTLMSDPNSGFPQEELYAAYANRRKAMANEARKEAVNLPNGSYSPAAASAFANEVASLKSKLNQAIKNKPYERMAVLQANETYRVQSKNIPKDLSKDDAKKEKARIKQQAMTAARLKVGASGKKSKITFTDKEWEAIMAGAVRPSVVNEILKNSTSETIKSMAMPRSVLGVTSGMRAVINNMDTAGYSLKDIADRVGVSPSTVSDVLRDRL